MRREATLVLAALAAGGCGAAQARLAASPSPKPRATVPAAHARPHAPVAHALEVRVRKPRARRARAAPDCATAQVGRPCAAPVSPATNCPGESRYVYSEGLCVIPAEVQPAASACPAADQQDDPGVCSLPVVSGATCPATYGALSWTGETQDAPVGEVCGYCPTPGPAMRGGWSCLYGTDQSGVAHLSRPVEVLDPEA